MASMRDIKLRIKSVEGTQQITKAMKLVSTAKLQRAKNRVEATRPYFEKTRETIASILGSTKTVDLSMLKGREVKKTAYIIITSDRGLAGGYNSNVCKLVQNQIKDLSTAYIIPVGKKGKDFFRRRGFSVGKNYDGFAEKPNYKQASLLGNDVFQLYNSEEIDEIYLAYTTFKSTINQEPTLVKLFPLDLSEFEMDKIERDEGMEYEPSDEVVLGNIIPKYINSVIYGALVESAASEQGARMTAMDSATNNAVEMISDLTLDYNRARQGSITQEISEIVGGAEALK